MHESVRQYMVLAIIVTLLTTVLGMYVALIFFGTGCFDSGWCSLKAAVFIVFIFFIGLQVAGILISDACKAYAREHALELLWRLEEQRELGLISDKKKMKKRS